MINKMPPHVRPLITAPQLNYRQSTIMTTPVDKTSPPSSPMEMVEPYCDAQPLEQQTATKELSGSREDGYDDTSPAGQLLDDDPHSLLLKKATSMNLESLLDNCGTLRQEDITPRSTKSEPYATTLLSQQQEQEQDHWNEQHYIHDKKDNIDHDDGLANDSKWNKLQSRLLDIITTTIHQELEKHYQSTPDDTSSANPMTTEEADTLSNDRSTTYLTGAPSPLSVPQWLQHGHVALEKMIADQHQERTKAMGLLEQRIYALEQQQQTQQQIEHCQKQDTQNEKTIYNALHERYMDLVTQHSHQLEKYQQLEQIHLSQSLALKHHHQKDPHPLTNPVTATSLPSPTQPPFDDHRPINTRYPHKQNKDVNTATPLDQQIHNTHRHDHYDMVSAPNLHHHPSLVADSQHSKSSHLQRQQSAMLPTPNASPTATQLASPTHSPTYLTATEPTSSGSYSLPPQQQNQSVKLDNGYVEFMTECNGQHVLCRVKLPKDADAGKVTTNTSKNNKNTKNISNSSTQSRRGHPNNYHQPQYQNNNINNNNKNSKTRAQHTTYQRYQQPVQQKHYYTRQQQQQQPHRYHLDYQPSPQQQIYHHRHHHHHYPHHYQQHQYQYQHQYQQCQKNRNAIHTSYFVQ